MLHRYRLGIGYFTFGLLSPGSFFPSSSILSPVPGEDACDPFSFSSLSLDIGAFVSLHSFVRGEEDALVFSVTARSAELTSVVRLSLIPESILVNVSLLVPTT